ncbi:MAG: hypothetical protein ABI876_15340 [Bacteroidota bacterium]
MDTHGGDSTGFHGGGGWHDGGAHHGGDHYGGDISGGGDGSPWSASALHDGGITRNGEWSRSRYYQDICDRFLPRQRNNASGLRIMLVLLVMLITYPWIWSYYQLRKFGEWFVPL